MSKTTRIPEPYIFLTLNFKKVYIKINSKKHDFFSHMQDKIYVNNKLSYALLCKESLVNNMYINTYCWGEKCISAHKAI